MFLYFSLFISPLFALESYIIIISPYILNNILRTILGIYPKLEMFHCRVGKDITYC